MSHDFGILLLVNIFLLFLGKGLRSVLKIFFQKVGKKRKYNSIGVTISIVTLNIGSF